ncbi:hypothetical protein [Variovorax ginsengisoli]|uniref:Uncharacterized protein n=1 Tax=Variovorax ginsengisoli TaxID=363844 RepID=A0ABT8S9G6_9BURK|nr:hypothetical protein [Variovorax ginsengisoli]MDN8615482.1 hypothetical protein [Variovorax ginsengisoli]MDO1534652.1 hypothetical protein [Variovorax ginsengisoli]
MAAEQPSSRRNLGPLTFAMLREIGGVGPSPPTGKRGRPRKQTIGDLNNLLIDAASRVAYLIAAQNNARGAQTRAIRKVAAELRQDVAWVKKAYQRHPLGRLLGELKHSEDELRHELQRRLLAMPDDVIERLGSVNAAQLLQFLRAKGIDGTSPQWFLDEARHINLLSPNSE